LFIGWCREINGGGGRMVNAAPRDFEGLQLAEQPSCPGFGETKKSKTGPRRLIFHNFGINKFENYENCVLVD
jgi:hypothetical protein